MSSAADKNGESRVRLRVNIIANGRCLPSGSVIPIGEVPEHLRLDEYLNTDLDLPIGRSPEFTSGEPVVHSQRSAVRRKTEAPRTPFKGSKKG